MADRCAIIAGSGAFPFHVAKEARRQGRFVVAMAIRGWADAQLASHVDHYEELAIGQLGQLIARLKDHEVRQAIMAGKVTKAALFDEQVSFDPEAVSLLSQVKDTTVNSVLGAIAQRLAREGIELLDSSAFLKDSLCPQGPVTARAPTQAELSDVRVGLSVARALATLDVGQTVVVKRKVIVAVEALEGTDAAIRRAGALAGSGLVVVKVASPSQDMRFDLPVLGTQTVSALIDAGASCVAVEAGKTLLLDKPALLAALDEAKISLIGVAA